MSEGAMFWTSCIAGLTWLSGIGLIWWRAGWKLALALAVGGPVALLFSAFVALFVFFLMDSRTRPNPENWK